MAGHSKFKNIQHRKGAQDKKRAKVFTKLVREIITAAKIGGIDPHNNPRLRSGISAARSQNLPKDRIDKALAQASDPSDTDNYTEIRYEGFLPGGIAIIVETLTDNKNRTASDVRSAFSKHGGNLGESGSVSFMFDRVGRIEYARITASDDEMLESAIEAGANDVKSDDTEHFIYTDIESFSNSLEYLSQKYGMPVESEIEWKPQTTIMIEDEEKATKILKLIDALEESDDVQKVFGNYELSEELFNKLSN
ncbi:MAG: YebC/PmpR family DNA-binding transcriptional regulator [Rickettsiaceae bacterium]|nr:YebC/PmpR family DNA-binding transcriptional regulator [Rickettsiaceae bacterium]MDP4832999.1 YebC/PmpR family DNA-binding transcriptional regulator [Rickettsiaceae bacterium]MDP5021278.1 YebC/PmpR family DNA-binding transcriptional regulator [Rickettsiaceae bacterium]MDP5082695.1 YebC/PmpR family DNA-binding transcriptional regulator [Rickettsiaceae bacterium]